LDIPDKLACRMNATPRHPFRRTALPGLLAAACLLGGSLGAQDPGRSPFLPEGFGAANDKAPAAASPLDRLELRGVMTIEGHTTAVLFDKSNNRSSSVELGATENNIKVSDYRPQDDSVLVESGGQSKRIRLLEAKIVAVAATPVPPPPVPGAPPPPVASAQPSGPGPVTPQMSDEEVRARMQRVAEEIRRRREMRRQMLERAQQQNQGAPNQ